MKERILTNWTFVRVLYVIMGSVVAIQSAISQQWFGVAFGGYFAAMGFFAFGCASGACFGSNCEAEPKQKTNIKDTPFEEVKTK